MFFQALIFFIKVAIAHLYINPGRTVLLWHKLSNIKKNHLSVRTIKKGREAQQPTPINIFHIHNLKKHLLLQTGISPHTTHYTIHTTHYTLHNKHFTLHTAHCTLHTIHYTLHTTHQLIYLVNSPVLTSVFIPFSNPSYARYSPTSHPVTNLPSAVPTTGPGQSPPNPGCSWYHTIFTQD